MSVEKKYHKRKHHMKRWIAGAMTGLLILVNPMTLTASEGEIGFFGGISEGDYLPKTIEKYVDLTDNTTPVYAYKEMVFISGEPVEVTGTITVDVEDDDILTETSGIYKERFIVAAENEAKGVRLARSLTLETAYYIIEGEFKRQIVKDSTMTDWVENITTDAGSYSLDEDTAIFSKATVEDITAGVSYYSTILSYSATFNDSDGNEIEMMVEGNIYGYKQPWSRVERQILTMSLQSEPLDMNMNIQLNPKLEAKKTIYYDENEPFPISFGGTYNQRMEREATMDYEILSYHPELTDSQMNNSMLLTTANQIEKLPIPEGLDFLGAAWYADDIRKLYSMRILTEVPHENLNYEAMSRGEYVKALCLAMDLDISKYENPLPTALQVFGDVDLEHPLYPYIMAAYNAKLVKGTGANFDVDLPITREEAFVIYIRIIGLERLGITNSPTTPFVDDAKISSWAKKEIVAGYRLGIIKGTDKNYLNPKAWISKAEAATIINRLIDYLREDIAQHY